MKKIILLAITGLVILYVFNFSTGVNAKELNTLVSSDEIYPPVYFHVIKG